MDFVKLKFNKAVIRPASQYYGEHLDIVCEEKKKVAEGILSTYPTLSIYGGYKVTTSKEGSFVTITLPLKQSKDKKSNASGIDVKGDDLPF